LLISGREGGSNGEEEEYRDFKRRAERLDGWGGRNFSGNGHVKVHELQERKGGQGW